MPGAKRVRADDATHDSKGSPREDDTGVPSSISPGIPNSNSTSHSRPGQEPSYSPKVHVSSRRRVPVTPREIPTAFQSNDSAKSGDLFAAADTVHMKTLSELLKERRTINIFRPTEPALENREHLRSNLNEAVKEILRLEGKLQKSANHQADPAKTQLEIKFKEIENTLSDERKQKSELQLQLDHKLEEIRNYEQSLTSALEEKKKFLETLDVEHQKRERLSKKLQVEQERRRKLEKHVGQLQAQIEQREQYCKDVRLRTIYDARQHVLQGLVKIFAELNGSPTLNADNIAESLHEKFIQVIDHDTTWKDLTNHVQEYYIAHPKESVVLFGTTDIRTIAPKDVDDPIEDVESDGEVDLPVNEIEQHSEHQFDSLDHVKADIMQKNDVDFGDSTTTYNSITGQTSDSYDQMPPEGNESFQSVKEKFPRHRMLCKFILHPRGCARRAQCTFSHPGDDDCPITESTVQLLHVGVSRTYKAVLKAEKATQGQEPSQQDQEDMIQVQVAYIQAYYSFISAIIQEVVEANLPRKSRVLFLETMKHHVVDRFLAEVNNRATSVGFLRCLEFPKGQLMFLASGIRGWFNSPEEVPQVAYDVMGALAAIDGYVSLMMEADQEAEPYSPAEIDADPGA